MTTEQRAALLGDKLTTAVDRVVAVFDLTEEQHDAVGDLLAELLGRVTEQAGAPFRVAWKRMDALERAVGMTPEDVS